MSIFRKSLYVGTLLMAPLILNAYSVSANSKLTINQPNVQTRRVNIAQRTANQQPIAMRNAPLEKNDSKYWTNRTNLAAYQRQNYYYPDINWNARDLGGYYAGHGKWVKTGVVYRGANLHHISQHGVQQMKQLHINEVIDLRSYYHQGGNDPGEDQPNRPNPLGTKYVEAVVNTRSDKRLIAPYKRMYGGEWYKYATSFMTWPHARQAYHQVFTQLLNHNNGAVYFHCINGDDRTGIMSILFLSSLGVSKWHIYNDYMITNYYHRHKMSYRYKASEINHFYWGIRHYYGTVNNYLLSPLGVGLTKAQIQQMCNKYLVDYKG